MPIESTRARERGGVRRCVVWFATAEEKKMNGRFTRVGSSRVRVVFFTEDARERGGRSGDCDG